MDDLEPESTCASIVERLDVYHGEGLQSKRIPAPGAKLRQQSMLLAKMNAIHRVRPHLRLLSGNIDADCRRFRVIILRFARAIGL
jgi:hypothetical protein